jgi:soluble lytic murein transglycosylase-like protein
MDKNKFGWNEADLRAEFKLSLDIVPQFQSAGQAFRFKPSLLMAIASRETDLNPHFRTHAGDGGMGHGPMQIDSRSFPEFCNSDEWKDPSKAIAKGAEVLASKLIEAQGAGLDGDDALRVAIAGYNGGTRRAKLGLADGNVDEYDTHHNYCADVMAREPFFDKFLCELTSNA